MRRNALKKLAEWKDSPDRKPMVLKGARQVGKTWIMKEFGSTQYSNYVYFNFDEETSLESIFESNKNPHRIIETLSLLSGEPILPETTLIIMDEIQECPAALNSLKYFNEKANEYHIIVAGSLLGTLLAQPHSFPVGKVNLMSINPLTFEEFLDATNPNLYSYYETIRKDTKIEEVFHERLLDTYSTYLIIGGMPECVAAWIARNNPKNIVRVQSELIQLYENDFSKHNGRINSGRLLQVFRSIPSQLSKSNEKFIYGAVREGGRARDFEEAIEWLVSAGMLNRTYGVSKIEHPLAAYDKMNNFKLFLFDTGLLKHMSGLDNRAVMLNTAYQFKGPLTENYVLQQLREKLDVSPRYYADKTSEIDFLIQYQGDIIPVEVKGGEDKSSPSFKRYVNEHNPTCAIRYSRRNYIRNGNIVNVPLYLAGKTPELI